MWVRSAVLDRISTIWPQGTERSSSMPAARRQPRRCYRNCARCRASTRWLRSPSSPRRHTTVAGQSLHEHVRRPRGRRVGDPARCGSRRGRTAQPSSEALRPPRQSYSHRLLHASGDLAFHLCRRLQVRRSPSPLRAVGGRCSRYRPLREPADRGARTSWCSTRLFTPFRTMPRDASR